MSGSIARELGTERPLRARPYLALILPLEGPPEIRSVAGTEEDESRLWDYALSSPAIRAILDAANEAMAA